MKLILSVLSVVLHQLVFAQADKKADSLLKILHATSIDTVKIKTLTSLGKHYVKSAPKKATVYANEGIALAEKKKLDKFTGNLYLLLGDSYKQLGNNDTALLYLGKALAHGEKYNDVPMQIRALNLTGFINTSNAKYEDAAGYLFKALKLTEKINDSILMSNTLNSICALYYDQANYSKALDYGERALAILVKKGSDLSIGGGYLNVGLIYADIKNEVKAEAYYKNALQYLQKTNGNLSIATVYGNLALLSTNSMNTKLNYLLSAKKIWDEYAPEHPNGIGNMSNLGYAYFEATLDSNFNRLQPADGVLKNKTFLLSKAELYLNTAYTKCKEMNLEKDLHVSTGRLAKVEEAKGNFHLANKYLNEYITLNDSIYSQENKNKIAAIEGEREIAIRDKQIELNNISIAAQKKVRISLIVGLLLLAIIGAMFYWQSRTRRRTNTTLLKLNNELDEANKVKARFFGIISHDLRSPIASLVSFLNLQQEEPGLFTKEQEEKHRASLTNSAESLLETMESMLQWSKSQMDHFKPRLVQTKVDDLFKNIEANFPGNDNYKISFQNPGELDVITDTDYLKTILHNLTANAIKALPPGKNGLIEWKAYQQNGKILLSITDNGPGVSEKQLEALYNKDATVNSKNGLGLHLVRDLANAIHCIIHFNSKPGAGTTFELVLN